MVLQNQPDSIETPGTTWRWELRDIPSAPMPFLPRACYSALLLPVVMSWAGQELSAVLQVDPLSGS